MQGAPLRITLKRIYDGEYLILQPEGKKPLELPYELSTDQLSYYRTTFRERLEELRRCWTSKFTKTRSSEVSTALNNLYESGMNFAGALFGAKWYKAKGIFERAYPH